MEPGSGSVRSVKMERRGDLFWAVFGAFVSGLALVSRPSFMAGVVMAAILGYSLFSGYTATATRLVYTDSSLSLRCWPWSRDVDLTSLTEFQYVLVGKSPNVYVKDSHGSSLELSTLRMKQVGFWGRPVLRAAESLEGVDGVMLSDFRRSVETNTGFIAQASKSADE